MDESDFEGDLSPITIFLIGCLVSSMLFAIVRRIIESSASNSKFKRRTRQEEEELLARQPQRLVVGPQVEVEEEEKELEDEEDNESSADEESGSEFGNNEADEVVDGGGNMNQQMDNVARRMSKKELNKIEKKKKKQERQEAWRHMLDHERRLRELREAEEKEREEFEKKQEIEKRKKRENTIPESRNISGPGDEELFAFLANYPSKLIRQSDVTANFPYVEVKKLLEQCERVISRFRTCTILRLSDDQFLRIDSNDIAKLRAQIRSKGHIPLNDLVEELLACSS